jgi:allantoate deiminase/N-carbamoyl-L-amino-acid hydrolase
MITLEQLNTLSPAGFVARLEGIFEHSPWVAQRAAAARPFTSRLQLLDAMRTAVDAATPDEQLSLIRAHPQLGVRGRGSSQLTVASAREQRRAGLNACTAGDAARLVELNARYLERFGFPFILAVRGHDPASIIQSFERRLQSDGELERHTALEQIGAIAAYRIADCVASPPGAEIVAMLERLAGATEAAGAYNGSPGADTSITANGLVREWMQAAGLEVEAAPSGYLIGQAPGPPATGRTLLIGVCRDPWVNAARYEGRAGFIVGIEVAQQLRYKGALQGVPLAVMARPGDARVGELPSLLAGEAPAAWASLADVDDAEADAEGREIFRALRAVQLAEVAVALARRANPRSGQRVAAAFTAGAAEQAARALEESVWRAQTAA